MLEQVYERTETEPVNLLTQRQPSCLKKTPNIVLAFCFLLCVTNNSETIASCPQVRPPGKVTRQISLRREQIPFVKRCLANYQKLKAAIEEICEINRQLLRAEPADDNQGGKTR